MSGATEDEQKLGVCPALNGLPKGPCEDGEVGDRFKTTRVAVRDVLVTLSQALKDALTEQVVTAKQAVAKAKEAATPPESGDGTGDRRPASSGASAGPPVPQPFMLRPPPSLSSERIQLRVR